jgi:hypothetical protein
VSETARLRAVITGLLGFGDASGRLAEILGR